MTFLVLAAALTQPPVQPPKFDLRDWTPRPASAGEPWERMKDPDWDDPRFEALKNIKARS